MPDTYTLPASSSVTADAIEDARRWLDRAAQCERDGMMRAHCLAEAEAAIEVVATHRPVLARELLEIMAAL